MKSKNITWLLLLGQLFIQLVIAQLELNTDKLAYCRALQRLDLHYEDTSCAHILDEDELTMTGELLMDTEARCWGGWELFGRRCRKRV